MNNFLKRLYVKTVNGNKNPGNFVKATPSHFSKNERWNSLVERSWNFVILLKIQDERILQALSVPDLSRLGLLHSILVIYKLE